MFGHDFLPQRTYVYPTVSNNKGNKYDHNTDVVTVRNDFYDKDWSTPFFIRVMLLVYYISVLMVVLCIVPNQYNRISSIVINNKV